MLKQEGIEGRTDIEPDRKKKKGGRGDGKKII